jgi:hypothetical protein
MNSASFGASTIMPAAASASTGRTRRVTYARDFHAARDAARAPSAVRPSPWPQATLFILALSAGLWIAIAEAVTWL